MNFEYNWYRDEIGDVEDDDDDEPLSSAEDVVDDESLRAGVHMLGLSKSYVPSWTDEDAFRELFQNWFVHSRLQKAETVLTLLGKTRSSAPSTSILVPSLPSKKILPIRLRSELIHAKEQPVKIQIESCWVTFATIERSKLSRSPTSRLL